MPIRGTSIFLSRSWRMKWRITGGALRHARERRGRPLLSESLAWYSAMGVVERTFGREHLQRLLSMMREAYSSPRTRAEVPLLRAYDSFHAYRKGPFAMYALREYAGAEQVNVALRRLMEKYGAGESPLPTSLDLYRELQAVTPDSLHPLLVDLFEANTFWELATQRVMAAQTETGAWQVTLDVKARKVVVDTAGVETEVPMDDLIEVGVFKAADDGLSGEPLYLQMHRLRSGEHRLTVIVENKPSRAGIDPRNLLIEVRAGQFQGDHTSRGPEEMMNAGWRISTQSHYCFWRDGDFSTRHAPTAVLLSPTAPS